MAFDRGSAAGAPIILYLSGGRSCTRANDLGPSRPPSGWHSFAFSLRPSQSHLILLPAGAAPPPASPSSRPELLASSCRSAAPDPVSIAALPRHSPASWSTGSSWPTTSPPSRSAHGHLTLSSDRSMATSRSRYHVLCRRGISNAPPPHTILYRVGSLAGRPSTTSSAPCSSSHLLHAVHTVPHVVHQQGACSSLPYRAIRQGDGDNNEKSRGWMRRFEPPIAKTYVLRACSAENICF